SLCRGRPTVDLPQDGGGARGALVRRTNTLRMTLTRRRGRPGRPPKMPVLARPTPQAGLRHLPPPPRPPPPFHSASGLQRLLERPCTCKIAKQSWERLAGRLVKESGNGSRQ